MTSMEERIKLNAWKIVMRRTHKHSTIQEVFRIQPCIIDDTLNFLRKVAILHGCVRANGVRLRFWFWFPICKYWAGETVGYIWVYMDVCGPSFLVTVKFIKS